ncbi:MAG: HAD-IIA family hydrolase [Candidatus Thorarchaeota archaeon]
MTLGEKKLWLFDVDNTLIHDVEHPTPFKDALALWKALMKKGVELAILTNVGRLSSRQVNQSLEAAGFILPVEKVFTAGAATAAYIHNRSPGARCFVIGEGGAQEDFVVRGLDVTNNPPIEYVAVGADRGMTFKELNFATKMVKEGAKLLCISGSRDYPGVYLGDEDTFIGERSIVAAIEHATGAESVVVGKPLPEIVVEPVKALGFAIEDAVIVGDNPASDIAGGNAAGLTTVLVQRDPDNIVTFESGDLDTKPDISVKSLDEVIPMIE